MKINFKGLKRMVFTSSFIFLGILVVKAQNTATATTTVTAKIPIALQLSVTAGSVVDFDFTSNVSLLSTGIEKLNAVTLLCSSNKPWFLNINAVTSNFSGGDAANPLPSTVIQFKNNANSTYTPLTTTPVSLSGTTGAKNPGGTSSVSTDLKLAPGFSYAPASDYSLGIIYTITNI